MVIPRRLIALQTIEDNHLFAAGSVFRIENPAHIFNQNRPAYYDYMLVVHPDEECTMMTVNISVNTIKAGRIISHIESDTAYFVPAQAVKRSLGIDRVFYCEY